jgi:hypothetical protein
MTTLNEWKKWVKKLGYAEKARAERITPSGFTARRRDRPGSKPAAVRDISVTGLQVQTEERWPVEELVSLTIEAERLAEGKDRAEPRINVDARVARHAEDGVGLRFVLPEGIDPNLWKALLTGAMVLEGKKDALYTFRVLRTVLFLTRICHADARDNILMLGGELDQHRTTRAMEIACRAEELLELEPNADKLRADPELVRSILRFGSWADGLTEQLWAGLLATTCSVDGKDKSNSRFVDMMASVTNTQCRILLVGCSKGMKLKEQGGESADARAVFSPEQMVRLSGMVDVGRIGSDVAYMFNAGLLEKNFDFTSYLPAESFDITPTALGLELYERCKGSRIELDTAPPGSAGPGT